MFGLRSDENNVMLFDNIGKARVFAEKPIAGVDRVRAANFRRRNDRRDVQITVGSRRWADADCLVGKADVHCVGIGG